jgi:hypothetical protein
MKLPGFELVNMRVITESPKWYSLNRTKRLAILVRAKSNIDGEIYVSYQTVFKSGNVKDDINITMESIKKAYSRALDRITNE